MLMGNGRTQVARPRYSTTPALSSTVAPKRPRGALQEIAAMLLEVEAQQVVAQQAFEQFLPPGADTVDLPRRPGNMPEVHDRQVGETLAEQARTERQVVILHPDHSPGAAAFLRHYVGKGGIDLLIVAPVERFEHRALELQVAQRPQGAIGQTIIKAAHLCLAQPHT